VRTVYSTSMSTGFQSRDVISKSILIGNASRDVISKSILIGKASRDWPSVDMPVVVTGCLKAHSTLFNQVKVYRIGVILRLLSRFGARAQFLGGHNRIWW